MTDKSTQVKLIQHMGSDLTVVNAARVSFNRESLELDDKDHKLIKYLADNKHYSPFEHTSATFSIKCTLPIAMQIMRHRAFSYNQVSRRYTAEDISCHSPDIWRKQGGVDGNKQGSHGEVDDPEYVSKVYNASISHAIAAYDELLQEGVCREQARFVLPQGLITKFLMTGNLRNWAHFLELRLDNHAQKEVRDLAVEMAKALLEIAPLSVVALLGERVEE